MRGGDLSGELALAVTPAAPLDQTVHQIARALPYHGAKALDTSWRERGNGNLAERAMLGRIHPDDHAHLTDTLVLFEDELLLAALQYDAETVREQVGLLGDLADMRVAHDRIEGIEARGLTEVQSVQSAQVAPLVVGDAALAVDVRRDEIESVDVGHLVFSPATGIPRTGHATFEEHRKFKLRFPRVRSGDILPDRAGGWDPAPIRDLKA